MPANERSALVTQRYQRALGELQGQAALHVQAAWPAVDRFQLASSYQHFAVRAQRAIEASQGAGATLSGAYLGAYTTSETGEPVTTPAEAQAYVGQTPADVGVGHALQGTLLMALERIAKRDHALPFADTMTAALAWALARNMRLAAESAAHAARSALHDLIGADSERYAGWRRVARPTACAACLASATGKVMALSAPFLVHPHCACVEQVVVRGVPDRVRQLTGTELVAAMTASQQDELLGADSAKELREGRLRLAHLAEINRMNAQPDQLQTRAIH
jgi:hypothetical protein